MYYFKIFEHWNIPVIIFLGILQLNHLPLHPEPKEKYGIGPKVGKNIRNKILRLMKNKRKRKTKRRNVDVKGASPELCVIRKRL